MAPSRLEGTGFALKHRIEQYADIGEACRPVVGDVTSADDWSILFTPNSIDSLLSEHMLEHLTEDEARTALTECYRYLKPAGLFRLAVPDGFRRDPAYVKEVAPPADGHKVLYTIDSLTALLKSVGFTTTPLEYFDAQEQFHAVAWDQNEGMIMRSVRFDTHRLAETGPSAIRTNDYRCFDYRLDTRPLASCRFRRGADPDKAGLLASPGSG